MDGPSQVRYTAALAVHAASWLWEQEAARREASVELHDHRALSGHMASPSSRKRRESVRSQPQVTASPAPVWQGHGDPGSRPGLQADSSSRHPGVCRRSAL
jgi:hypothetical protein